MRSQSEFEQKSTKIYVRNLQCYSVAQLCTYGPSVYVLFGMAGYINYRNSYELIISQVLTGLANLSGFVNVVIFMSQRTVNVDNTTLLDRLDLDLTCEETP